MGNPLLKQYNVDRDPVIPGTRHGRWTVHRGRHVDRPGVDVSLFTCNLKASEFSDLSTDGPELQQLRALLQQDAQLLQRLRHPRMLQVVDPPQQGKDSWVFCTKPLALSLRQLLGDVECFQKQDHEQWTKTGYVPPDSAASIESTGASITSLSSSSSSKQQQKKTAVAGATDLWDSAPSLLEVKCGLVDIAEALSFLHKSAHLMHLNIHPESIFIDTDGHWKLGGLFFAKEFQSLTNSVDCRFCFGNVSAAVSLSPPLRYTAPELSCAYPAGASAAADVFSFSFLVAECLGASGLPSGRDADTEKHRQQCSYLSPLLESSFPPGSLFQQGAQAGTAAAAAATSLLQLLSRGLSQTPEDRPAIEEFLRDSFLLSTETRALRFLSCLHEKEQQQQQQFLAGLLPLLKEQEQLHQPRLLRMHILEPLLSALKYPSLYPVLLPNIFCGLKKLEDVDYFREIAWPRLQPLLTAKEIQVKEFQFLVSNSTEQMKANDLLPFLLKCLDIQAGEIQRAALVALRACLGAFDYTSQRNLLLPRVLSLISNAETSAVRLAGLEGLGAMAKAFDRAAIETQILPVIQQASKVDRSPCICTAISSNLSCLSRSLALVTTAEKVLPIFFSLLLEDKLSVEEYRRIDAEVKAILRKVDEDRQRHFAVKAEQQSAVEAALPAGSTVGPPLHVPPPPPVAETSFESLLADPLSTITPLSIPRNILGAAAQELPAPPLRPPEPPAAAAVARYSNHTDHRPRKQQQQQNAHKKNDLEDLLASLSARLPDPPPPAPETRTDTTSSTIKIPACSPFQSGSSDLGSILAAASAAVPQAKTPSFDAFGDLIESNAVTSQPGGLQPATRQLVNCLDQPASHFGKIAPAGDPFAGLGCTGLGSSKPAAYGTPAPSQGVEVTSSSTPASRGYLSPEADPFAGLGFPRNAEATFNSNKLAFGFGSPVPLSSSLGVGLNSAAPGMAFRAPAGDPFAGIESLSKPTTTADPFANLEGLSAISSLHPKSNA